MRKAWNKTEWTEEMDSFLQDNYQSMTNQELADKLGLKLTTTRSRLLSMGLKRMELEYWTQEQVQFLQDNYQDIGDVELAEIFTEKWQKNKGWTKKHIEKKRRYLKLKRTAKQKKAIFQRNKEGGRWAMCAHKRWKATGVFPEGQIRYWKTSLGRLVPFIKVDGRYVHYARHRYEQLHGKIKKGMNIVFLDRDPFNLEDDNLVSMTNEELALFNCHSASVGLSDNYVAGILSHKQPELREEIKKYPELIELKRQQIILNRNINESI